MTAEIIEFPGSKRLCGDCENAYIGTRGVYCGMFSEYIDDETEAGECEEWTP